MGTGILYAAIVVAWAAYLLPVVKHRREKTTDGRVTAPVSSAMRVLGKRSSGARPRSRSAVADVGSDAQASTVSSEESDPRADSPAEVRRRSALSAARRRRVLALIVGTTVVVGVFAFVGTVPWWSLTIPVGLLMAFVVVARLSVRAARSRRRATARQRSHSADTSPNPADIPDSRVAIVSTTPLLAITAAAEVPVSNESRDDVDAATGDADATTDPAIAAAAAWVAHSPVDAWDPLPITLPTYVTKAAAPTRRVRTIDLSGGSAFSAGRLPEAALLSRQDDSIEDVGEADGRTRDDGQSRATG